MRCKDVEATERATRKYVRASPQIHKPQSSRDASHRGSGPHDSTGPSRRCQLLVQLRDVLDIDFVCPVRGPVVSAVRTGANALTSEAAWHHGTGDQGQDGLAGGYAAHDLGRDCLVTSCIYFSDLAV